MEEWLKELTDHKEPWKGQKVEELARQADPKTGSATAQREPGGRGKTSFVCVQIAGEVVVVPDGWWHATYNLPTLQRRAAAAGGATVTAPPGGSL